MKRPPPWLRSHRPGTCHRERSACVLKKGSGSTFCIKESSLSRWDPCYSRITVAPERGGVMLQTPRVPTPPLRPSPSRVRGTLRCSRPTLQPGGPCRGCTRSHGYCGHTTLPARASSPTPSPPLPACLASLPPPTDPRARYRELPSNPGLL